MNTDAPVSDDDLHAFVDGQLEAARMTPVLQHLQRHPDAAVRVAHWHAQRFALRRLHRQLDPGPVPATLANTVLRHGMRRRTNPWIQAAAAVVLVAAGAAGMRIWQQAPDTAASTAAAAPPQFVRDAMTAYAVYAPEIRHPVEVSGEQEAQLVQWLSRRLGRPLAAPALQDHGFHLLGGRLLPGDAALGPDSGIRSGPIGASRAAPHAVKPGDNGSGGNALARAQFMYEDTRSRRVTLYVAVFPGGVAPHETAFRSVQAANGTSFYWVENGYGYALNGDLPASELQALASDVYDQLFPR
jgi:anti-sigma factor RsiW